MFGLVWCRRLQQVSSFKRNTNDSAARLFFLVRDAVGGIRSCSSSYINVESKDSSVESYLVNSFGFSLGDATSLSKNRKCAFDSLDKPDSVLDFLKRNGFSFSHIRKIVRTCPQVLVSNADTVFSPKVSFFRSVGLSDDDVVMMFTTNPLLFLTSLKNKLAPWYSLLKSMIEQDAKIIHFLKSSPYVLCLDLQQVVPKISILRETGVPDLLILRLLRNQHRAFGLNGAKFGELVKEIMDMNIDPAASNFVPAFEVFRMNKATLAGRIDVYKDFGLSEDEIWSMFKKNPQILKPSEKLVRSKMDFLMNKMGYQLQSIIRYPWILNYSLEKRTVPRCSVIRVLELKGLLNLGNPLCTVSVSDSDFSELYVEKYLDRLPELLDIYQGKTGLEDLCPRFLPNPQT